MFCSFFRKSVLILHCRSSSASLSCHEQLCVCAVYCEGRLSGLTAVVWTGVSHSTLHMLLTPAVITWFCAYITHNDCHRPRTSLSLCINVFHLLCQSPLWLFISPIHLSPSSNTSLRFIVPLYFALASLSFSACLSLLPRVSSFSLSLVPCSPVLPKCNDMAQEWFIPEQHHSGVS